MKRIIIIFLMISVLAMSCNWRTDVTSSDIPNNYKTLEFWNGGGKIAVYKDVTMKIEIVTSYQGFGKDVYFYKYHITSHEQQIDDWIIDSEALALKYTL